jgi:hypothetical protein
MIETYAVPLVFHTDQLNESPLEIDIQFAAETFGGTRGDSGMMLDGSDQRDIEYLFPTARQAEQFEEALRYSRSQYATLWIGEEPSTDC